MEWGNKKRFLIMPVTINFLSLDPLCKDYEYSVSDMDTLAELVAILCRGKYKHANKIIRYLATEAINPDEKGIRHLLSELDTTGKGDEYRDRIHGWLFQMMSWIALAEQHKADNFRPHYPHSQPSMHGLDGIAITLKEDGGIDRIIVTEDKCTEHPRDTIRDKIWPEFDDMENGANNNAIEQQVQSLIVEDGVGLNIQNDITDEKYRQYRIGITREKCHNSEKGRKGLFKGYDEHIKGEDIERRTGATIYLEDVRGWMEELRLRVIDKLNEELKKCTTPEQKA